MMTMTRATTDSHRNTNTPVIRRREKAVGAKDGKRANMRAKNPNGTNPTKLKSVKKHSLTERELVAIVLPMMNLS